MPLAANVTAPPPAGHLHASASGSLASIKVRKRKSALRRLLSNPTSLPGFIVLVPLILTAIFAEQIGGDPYGVVPADSLKSPP